MFEKIRERQETNPYPSIPIHTHPYRFIILHFHDWCLEALKFKITPNHSCRDRLMIFHYPHELAGLQAFRRILTGPLDVGSPGVPAGFQGDATLEKGIH